MPIESIHFHEVGAVERIVDIVCASVGCQALGVDRFICSPLNVGGGTVKCATGSREENTSYLHGTRMGMGTLAILI